MLKDTKPKTCYQGHILANYHRRDGRCGRCHTLRQDRYHRTQKGREVQLTREAKRRREPKRILYRLKWLIQASIAQRQERIAELERIYRVQEIRYRNGTSGINKNESLAD